MELNLRSAMEASFSQFLPSFTDSPRSPHERRASSRSDCLSDGGKAGIRVKLKSMCGFCWGGGGGCRPNSSDPNYLVIENLITSDQLLYFCWWFSKQLHNKSSHFLFCPTQLVLTGSCGFCCFPSGSVTKLSPPRMHFSCQTEERGSML